MVAVRAANAGLVHVISELNHHEAPVAAEIMRVQQAAYRAEADLIGFDGIPPLHETAEDVAALELTLLGVRDDSARLVGLIGYRRTGEAVDIDRLAVDPDHHHRGIGTSLLEDLHRREATATAFDVSTGTANVPAIRLYQRLGYLTTGTEDLSEGITVERLRRGRTAPPR